MAFTFRGGLFLPQQKNTKKSPLTAITPPAAVTIPLLCYEDLCCRPCVCAGEEVLMGQIIGKEEQNQGSPVHASISGKVTAITDFLLESGEIVPAVVIENDFKDRISPDVKPFLGDIKKLSSKDIVEVLKGAAIIDAASRTPVYRKLSKACGKALALIIDCTEPEPHGTTRRRLLAEHPESVIGGIKILLKALSLRNAVIALEKGDTDGLKALCAQKFEKEMIRFCVMKNKFPLNNERLLIHALSGKEIPFEEDPCALGYLVFGADTCADVYNAFATGMPQIKRAVTVDGDCIQTPANLTVPVGTPFLDLLEECFATRERIRSLISGDLLSGRTVMDENAPVLKDCTVLLACSKKRADGPTAKSPCIRCGKCVSACPMKIVPTEIYRAQNNDDLQKCAKLSAELCIGCGCCSCVCPAGLDLSGTVLRAKNALESGTKREPKDPIVKKEDCQ
jgi:electron transport complex protein RnfC